MQILSATMVAGMFRSLLDPPSRGFWHIRELRGTAQEA
jgi:hypothetical protein